MRHFLIAAGIVLSAMAFVMAFAALIQFVGLVVRADSAEVRWLLFDAAAAFVLGLWARYCWRIGLSR